MTRLNSTVMKKGYIVSVLNFPIMYNGDNFPYLLFAQLKNGSYAYMSRFKQFSMNFNINPNMWAGMATGVYGRSTYLPDYMYAFL
jgi:hypothetical protein